MKTFHSLIFFVLLATLQDGDACLRDLDHIRVRTGTVGQSITLGCFFDDPLQMKIFCRNDCEGKAILVLTAGKTKAQTDRYSMEYNQPMQAISIFPVFVTITDLRKSDSGIYICKINSTSSDYFTQTFELNVMDAETAPQPKLTPRPFLTSTSRAPTPETPPSSASELNQLPNITGLLDLLSTPTPPASALETPSADESNRVPEGDREDDHQSTSPPVETPAD